MAIGVWPDSSAHGGSPELRDMLLATFADASRRLRVRKGDPEVLLEGNGGESLAFTFDECEQWFRDYDFPLVDVNIAPAAGNSASTALCIVRFSPAVGGNLNAV